MSLSAEERLKRIRSRAETWSLNDDTARVSVNLGDLRALLARNEGRETAEREARVWKAEATSELIERQAAEARVKALTQTLRRVREFVELEADRAGALETDYADEARETLEEIDDVLLQGEGSK